MLLQAEWYSTTDRAANNILQGLEELVTSSGLECEGALACHVRWASFLACPTPKTNHGPEEARVIFPL